MRPLVFTMCYIHCADNEDLCGQPVPHPAAEAEHLCALPGPELQPQQAGRSGRAQHLSSVRLGYQRPAVSGNNVMMFTMQLTQHLSDV